MSRKQGNQIDGSNERPPTAFISYSWEEHEHQEWVHDFAARLRQDGVDVTLDRWHAVPGDQLPSFMERAVQDNDFVLITCTPKYKQKSDNRQGGVGYEGDVMTGEVLTSGNHRKFIPVLRKGDWTEAGPSWLKGKYYIDLRGEPYSEERYQYLLSTLHGQHPQPPPLGPPPFKKTAPRQKSKPPAAPTATRDTTLSEAAAGNLEHQPLNAAEPIKIERVVVDEVTVPLNDGTRGCGLYAVPFQLSQYPSSDWARLFVETWDHPPQWTNMHRPGIALVKGNRVILDGTTMEEVERYHQDTLKVVLDEVNRRAAVEERARQTREEVARKRLREQEEAIRATAARINFD